MGGKWFGDINQTFAPSFFIIEMAPTAYLTFSAISPGSNYS